MKLNQLGGRLTAAASVAGLSLLLLSCGASNTIDFVYVTSNLNNPGQINAFEVNSESGALRQIADSPYPSGGRNPVYIVTAPSGKFLYVANHDDNTIVQYAIGTDGKLYGIEGELITDCRYLDVLGARARRAGDSRCEPKAQEALCRRQLRRDRRTPAGKRAVRSRPRRVHWSGPCPRRRLRRGRWRDAAV